MNLPHLWNLYSINRAAEISWNPRLSISRIQAETLHILVELTGGEE